MSGDVGTSRAVSARPGVGERRRVLVLVSSQVLGGVGVASGIAVGGLLAQQVSGSTSLSGLAQTAGVLGAALLAVPLADLARARGRGVALSAGYGLGFLGAVLSVLAAVADQFWLLLVAIALFGGGTAAGLQARYAATDGVADHRRGRVLSTVVWATTIGSVAGPNLASAGGELADRLGVPSLSGPFLFSMAAFLAAGVLVLLGLRGPAGPSSPSTLESQEPPDPRSQDPLAPQEPPDLRPQGPLPPQGVPEVRGRERTWRTLRQVVVRPRALLGLVAVAGGHSVMIAVMVMTPVHLGDGAATLRVIGVVISLHIAGMYALSPLFGWAVDRWGEVPVIGLGVGVLGLALTTAASSQVTDHAQVGAALVLLGLGWSACLVAGSALLSASVPEVIRTSAQGAGDLVMGLCAAAAGVVAGPVLALAGYSWLSAGAALLLVPVLVLLVRTARTPATARPA